MLSAISVRNKLIGGFGLVVAALVGISALTVTGLLNVKSDFVDYRQIARKSLSAEMAMNAVTEARLHFMRFRATADRQALEASRKSLGDLTTYTTKLTELAKGTDVARLVDDQTSLVTQYQEAQARWIASNGEVDAAKARFEEASAALRAQVTNFMDASIRANDVTASAMAGRVQESLLLGRMQAERFTRSQDVKDATEAASHLSAAVKDLNQLRAEVADAARAAQVDTLGGQSERLARDFTSLDTAIKAREAIRAEVDGIGPKLQSGFKAISETAASKQNAIGPAAQAEAETTVWRATALAIIFSLVGAAIALVLALSISKAIGSITASMRRLADGDLEADIFGAGRQDEIGAMAKAVEVFKANAIERHRLEAEQEAIKAASEADKRRVMHQLAADFEAAVGGIVASVSASASQLKASAETLAATSEETSRQSASVAAASEQASVNVQTVASATEELSTSLQDVSRQVAQSARMSTDAVSSAVSTVDKVQALSQAADQIGNIVGLIQDIAGQTNLLALNATIEAARAGEAGKGFAVVASEVKNLADQTAKATTQIANQIGAIQSTTAESANAISTISDRIRDINAIATAIASAVEEQGVATQEIARNVQQAAIGTTEVSNSISGVRMAASSASSASSQVLSAADALADLATKLRAEMSSFVNQVRAA